MFPWMFPEYFLIHTHSPTSCRFVAQLRLIIIITMQVLCGPRGNTWWTRSSTPGIRRLVLVTLVLVTHVGKSYSASTLVLFLSASCSWDGGSRASAQLNLNVAWMFPECSLNPWMFPECCLNVAWMFPECSLNVPLMFPEYSLTVPWMLVQPHEVL
jgi:hypothetical protein